VDQALKEGCVSSQVHVDACAVEVECRRSCIVGKARECKQASRVSISSSFTYSMIREAYEYRQFGSYFRALPPKDVRSEYLITENAQRVVLVWSKTDS